MRITEIKTVKVVDACLKEPVYLQWHNALGGKSYWLFERFKQENVQTKELMSYGINVIDLETAQGTSDITGKEAESFIEVGAKVKAEDMDGLRGLFESGKVIMLTNPTTWKVDGAKWVKVTLRSGSLLVYQTDKAYFDVSFRIELPKTYTIQE